MIFRAGVIAGRVGRRAKTVDENFTTADTEEKTGVGEEEGGGGDLLNLQFAGTQFRFPSIEDTLGKVAQPVFGCARKACSEK